MKLAALLTIALLSQKPTSVAGAVKAADAAMTAANFTRALKLLDGIERAAATQAEWVRADLLRAECLMALKRPADAERAYADALRHDPGVTLDPTISSPRLIEALEKVRASLVGRLAIRSNVPGALVRLDGKELGPVPVEVPVLAGSHAVRVTGASGPPLEGRVEVVAGQTAQLVLDAEVRPAVIAAPAPAPSRALPMTLLGTGVAAVAVGGFFTASALAWNGQPKDQLTINQAVAAHAAAVGQRNLGLVLVAAGVAAGVTGAVLWTRAPKPVSAALWMTPDGAGLGMSGEF